MKTSGRILLGWIILACAIDRLPALEFPGPDPGTAQGRIENHRLVLENSILSETWDTSGGTLRPVGLSDRRSGKTLDLAGTETFRLILEEGKTVSASDLKMLEPPVSEKLEPESDAFTLARRYPGRQITVHLAANDGNLEIQWRAILRDGANAVRQELTITARKTPIALKEIQWVEIPAKDCSAAGSVPGSPLVSGNWFLAYEHPNALNRLPSAASVGDPAAKNRIAENRARCVLEINLMLRPGESLRQSAAAGMVPAGQLRRGFLYYLERERAHPYRPFLHYNAWYDICWDQKIREDQCLRVIESFGRELTEKRGVRLASFVWDDGWDDPKTLWQPVKENFPNGFSKMLAAARRYQSTLGFWLSPFGGYGKPAQDRYTYGKEQGFEFKGGKFALAGPKYHARFLETCAEMIDKNGSNFFKFDGLTQDLAETEAMLRLTRDLRKHRPDLFVSITTGTWPSPFWLWFGDSTWRGGDDMGFFGPGSKREQWITYRDMITYRNVVRAAPLYPLNSLMNQGIAQSLRGPAAELGNSREEMRREFRSFFACGTCLQELYVSAERMSPENWDDLAEAARWSAANAEVLVDTHWVGGDPGKEEAYGWASWSQRKGILALRNPSPKSQTLRLDPAKVFELPPNAPMAYELQSPWKSEKERPKIKMQAGSPTLFTLQPFEVSVYYAVPVQ